MAQQQQAIHKFVLGSKELEGKTAEFLYDRGWYSITDIAGEERTLVYRSRNAQEAYRKWNVYIGRKKERPPREDRRRDDSRGAQEDSEKRTERSPREYRERRENRSRREEKSGEYRENRRRRRDNYSRRQSAE